MQVAEFDHNQHRGFGDPRAGDKRLAVRFFIKAKQDGEASKKAQRPIFNEHEYVHIMVPGDRGHVVIRPVTEKDRVRFAPQYDHWKKTNNNELASGIALESWGILNLAQIEEYRYFGIRTVEHMANIRDDLAAKIPGTHQLKQRAKAHLEALAGEAPMKKMAVELEARDRTIEELKKDLAATTALVKQLQEAQNAGVKAPRGKASQSE